MELNRQLAINIGDSSNIVTAACFKKICSNNCRDVVASLILHSDIKESFKGIILGLCAVVLILNSQLVEVNTTKVKEISFKVYLKILETFPWCVISQSVHRVLGHG